MDKNNLIGWVLMFLLMMGYFYMTSPTQAELDAIQFTQDSLALEESRRDSLAKLPETATTSTQTTIATLPDSIQQLQLAGKFGVFAPAGSGTEQEQVLENDNFKITFTNKGGRIKEVELKGYLKAIENDDEERTKSYVPVKLLEDEKNQFEYLIPVGNVSAGAVSTADLYFTPQISGNTISFKANTSNGGYFEQVYTIDDQFSIDYNVKMQGLSDMLSRSAKDIQLQWVNYLDKIELNTWFERTYSTVYFKETDDDPDYCSCRGDDDENVDSPVKWVSAANQFFNTSLVADNSFNAVALDVQMGGEEDDDLKRIQADMTIPLNDVNGTGFSMKMYVGPNDFDALKAYSDGLEQIIPYGWSIFGTINRYVIRPFFEFLLSFISSKGLVILLLTFIIKMVLYPFTYKMLYSQQKMAALKPRMASMKEKYKDDAQKQQMETMKMYQEYGVSPLGGCLPMVMQMPIWYALFRFFPCSIDFRQESFLWADDLSSYDAFFHLPFELPFNMGDHLSLFAILWAVSMVLYTYYNSRHMDMSANPAMKYVQYGMPVMFFGFFNAYAAGLTCYMFFSNLLNITQYIFTKEVIIDKDKIEQELKDYKKKPKKKGGFSERLQNVMEESKRLQAQQEAAKKRKKKK